MNLTAAQYAFEQVATRGDDFAPMFIYTANNEVRAMLIAKDFRDSTKYSVVMLASAVWGLATDCDNMDAVFDSTYLVPNPDGEVIKDDPRCWGGETLTVARLSMEGVEGAFLPYHRGPDGLTWDDPVVHTPEGPVAAVLAATPKIPKYSVATSIEALVGTYGHWFAGAV